MKTCKLNTFFVFFNEAENMIIFVILFIAIIFKTGEIKNCKPENTK